jgi:peptide/nickel transport system permease protein
MNARRYKTAPLAGVAAATISRRRAPRRVLGDVSTLLGLLLVAGICGAALFAPLLAPHDPTRQYLEHAYSMPTSEFPFGADHLGRDILSRLLFGARTTLLNAGVTLLIALAVALTVGLVAGFYGGWVDAVCMRLVDLLLAFPGLILAVAVAGTLGPSLLNVMLALAVVWWAGYARIVRGLTLACREKEYVAAAEALGLPHWRIIWAHILPNIAGPVAVLASLDMGGIILSIAGLNFLGLGAQPPTPEWGAMLNDAQSHLQTDPQLVFYPAAAIFLAVLGFNLLGDGLRDALDPRER